MRCLVPIMCCLLCASAFSELPESIQGLFESAPEPLVGSVFAPDQPLDPAITDGEIYELYVEYEVPGELITIQFRYNETLRIFEPFDPTITQAECGIPDPFDMDFLDCVLGQDPSGNTTDYLHREDYLADLIAAEPRGSGRTPVEILEGELRKIPFGFGFIHCGCIPFEPSTPFEPNPEWDNYVDCVNAGGGPIICQMMK